MPFPLLPVAAWIAALTLVYRGGELVDPQQDRPGVVMMLPSA